MISGNQLHMFDEIPHFVQDDNASQSVVLLIDEIPHFVKDNNISQPIGFLIDEIPHPGNWNSG